MYKAKKFFHSAEQLLPLLKREMGTGLATDRIMVDGKPVGVMYRDEPDDDVDSGWRFLAGDETQEYADEADHWAIYSLNTIANYDRAVIPYLTAGIGSDFERVTCTDSFIPAEDGVKQ
jgi:hypothetical protein